MDSAQEQKVMQAFYDRIFQMVTYTPNTGSGQGVSLFQPNTTLVQLVTEGSIQLDDFKNMVTPVNVKGDLRASEAFYRRIDIPGGIGPVYQPTTASIGKLFMEIVNGANTSVQPTAQQTKEYDNVRKYLYQTVTQTDPVTGQTTRVSLPTQNFTNYNTYRALYLGAVSAYRSAYDTYDLSKPAQQRDWEAKAPVLQGNIDTAWNNWAALGDKAAVEEALNFLAASNNNIVANIIADAQAEMKANALASLTGGGDEWYLSYGSPFHWWDDTVDAGWAEFSLNSNYLTTSDNSWYSKSEGSAGSSFLGLISWGGGGGSSSSAQYHHMQGDNLSITAKMLTVTIERPWLSDALFRTAGWYETGQKAGWISNGMLDQTNATALMPVVPTAFVLMKDVSITANWTSQDSSALQTAVQASGGFSLGPFHAGGGGSSGSSSSSSTSSFVGGTLSIPSAQIVAWINQITPMSPPEAGPG